MQVLWGLDEAEVDTGLVPCPEAVSVHGQDGGCLPDAAAVDWCDSERESVIQLLLECFRLTIWCLDKAKTKTLQHQSALEIGSVKPEM